MSREKPQGASGPIVFTSDGMEWQVTRFPSGKAARELLVAELFTTAKLFKQESEPSLAPFCDLRQNEENDLDFSVQTSRGQMLLELVEFAPLKECGPTFKDAPRQLPQSKKFNLALQLITKKASHQGGPGRILVIYTTEHAFELDAVTIELLRRAAVQSPPSFERVYNVVPVTTKVASITEIYPGKPHSWFMSLTNEQLTAVPVVSPHPEDMTMIQAPGLVQAVGNDAAQLISEELETNPNYTIGPIARRPKP